MPSVLLLGATSDIATAIARNFAQNKYDVILAGRDTEALKALKSDIQIRYSVKANVVQFDAANFSEHNSFYNNLPFHPDVTICVFGYLGDQKKASSDWAEAQRIVQTNYTGAMSILNIISEDYAVKNKGTIVGISSVAGERGRQSNYIYGSAKAGFTAYLSGLRNHLFKYGVQVVTVLPGFVYTKMTADLKLPPLLTAKPEEVALVVKKAVDKKKNIIYVKWPWKWIMTAIKMIPEGIFKKMQL
ncbi:MAG TPA: SDR family oxidoreductase [Flavipsychrobacter sp.]|nr:SDR family oxidoreductase [Flavipsychrobacter sp.]